MAAPATPRPDLDWVDGFIASIRPYVKVRRADGILIRQPTEAYRLNDTALGLLEHLLGGGRMAEILARLPDDPGDRRRRDLFHFFRDLCALVQGGLGDGRGRRAVTVAPYAAPFTSLPVLAEIAVTYRCNLRCAFCYAACGCKKDEGAGELDTAGMLAVIDRVAGEAQVPSLSFTGGEPLLRPDLAALVRHAVKERGLRVNLITNGTLATPERMRELAAAGLTSAQLSLEAPEAALHDRLTGRPGSFARTLAGVGACREAGLHVHTNSTITRANREAVAGLPGLARSLGLDKLSMNLVIPAGQAAGAAELAVSYSEIGDVVRRVRAAARAAGVQFLWYAPTPLCRFNPVAEGLGNKSCAACDGLLSVAPDGQVLPCSSWPEPLGSLKDRPFRKIWESRRARWLRHKRFAPPECAGCADLAVCGGACPLYWDARGRDELDERAAAPLAAGAGG